MSTVQPVQRRAGEASVDVSHIEADLRRDMAATERRNRRISVYSPLLLVLFVGMAWEYSVILFELPAYFLPRPSQIVRHVFANTDLYLTHGLITFREVVTGYLMAVVVAVPLAIAITSSKIIERGVFPLLVSVHTIPKSALAPLFMVWFGFGLTPKVLVVYLISFFPIIINSVVGFKSIEQEKLYLAKATGLTKRHTFFTIKLPNALPSIFGGLKIGITLAVIGAVVAEFVGADGGLGYLMVVAKTTLNTTGMFASLFCLMILSTSFFLTLGLLEKRFIPWHVSQRQDLASLAGSKGIP